MEKCSERHFLGSLAASASARPVTMRVNGGRLRQHIEALSEFGRPSQGVFAEGVSRVAHSDAYVAGRRYVIGLMEGIGLRPRIDTAGNIFARCAGSDPSLAPVLSGSHLDSVPNGGNFDGDLGSLAAIEVVAAVVVSRRPRAPMVVRQLLARQGSTHSKLILRKL